MPKLQLDHVVSFTSEDPNYRARSLVVAGGGSGGGGWRVCRGEAEGAVCVRVRGGPVRVASLALGLVHCALLEVEAARSGAGAGAGAGASAYSTLVPCALVASPAESRRDGGGERVRVYSAASGASLAGAGDMLPEAAAHAYDTLRISLRQPYNKHVQCGLRFVHVYSEEAAPPPAPSAPPALCLRPEGASSPCPAPLLPRTEGGSGSDVEYSCETDEEVLGGGVQEAEGGATRWRERGLGAPFARARYSLSPSLHEEEAALAARVVRAGGGEVRGGAARVTWRTPSTPTPAAAAAGGTPLALARALLHASRAPAPAPSRAST